MSVEKDEILTRRAVELAKPPEQQQLGKRQLELLAFMLAHEKFALETKYIKEVYPMKELTPVPCAPSFVLGLINLRRRIITVLDIRPFFTLPVQTQREPRVLIVQDQEHEFGLVTDGILGIEKVAVDDIQVGMPTLTGIRHEFLLGVTENRLVILSGQKMIASPRLIVNDAVEPS